MWDIWSLCAPVNDHVFLSDKINSFEVREKVLSVKCDRVACSMMKGDLVLSS